MDVFLTGFGVSLSLILAIGAQNAFVLKQGLQGKHVALVVTICALTDAILIGVGVAGIDLITSQAPWITMVLLYGGAAFLFVYGARSFHSAWKADAALESSGSTDQTWQAAALTCIAVTWLNPHLYLDTVVLIGSVSSKYPGDGLTFWIGAAVASCVFFVSLGYGAKLLAPYFAKRRAWQILDIFVGCVMWTIAFGLVFG